MGSDEHPLPMLKLMIAKAAFEILVAEHALKLLNVSNPREPISKRTLSKELENLNSQDPLARAFNPKKPQLYSNSLPKNSASHCWQQRLKKIEICPQTDEGNGA
jgi:hypothetical protein